MSPRTADAWPNAVELGRSEPANKIRQPLPTKTNHTAQHNPINHDRASGPRGFRASITPARAVANSKHTPFTVRRLARDLVVLPHKGLERTAAAWPAEASLQEASQGHVRTISAVAAWRAFMARYTRSATCVELSLVANPCPRTHRWVRDSGCSKPQLTMDLGAHQTVSGADARAYSCFCKEIGTPLVAMGLGKQLLWQRCVTQGCFAAPASNLIKRILPGKHLVLCANRRLRQQQRRTALAGIQFCA